MTAFNLLQEAVIRFQRLANSLLCLVFAVERTNVLTAEHFLYHKLQQTQLTSDE